MMVSKHLGQTVTQTGHVQKVAGLRPARVKKIRMFDASPDISDLEYNVKVRWSDIKKHSNNQTILSCSGPGVELTANVRRDSGSNPM